MGEAPQHHRAVLDWTEVPLLIRRALIEQWTTARPAASLLLAPSGFGKTALAFQLLGSWNGPSAAVAIEPGWTPRDLERAWQVQAPSRPAVVLVDDCEFLRPDAVDVLLRVLADAHRLILAGRACADEIVAAIEGPTLWQLGPDDLVFSAAETAELCAMVAQTDVSSLWADVVHHVTAGVPAAVALAALQSTPASRGSGRTRAGMLEDLLSLPLLSQRLVGAATGDPQLLRRLGVRLNHLPDGWLEIPPEARLQRAMRPDLRRLAAAHYAADGRFAAVWPLFDGRDAELLDFLDAVPERHLTVCQGDELLARVMACPDELLAAHRGTVAKVSRSVATGWFVPERLELLGRVAALRPEQEDLAVTAAFCQLLSAIDDRDGLRAAARRLIDAPHADARQRATGLVAEATDLAAAQRLPEVERSRRLFLEARRLLGSDLTPVRGDLADAFAGTSTFPWVTSRPRSTSCGRWRPSLSRTTRSTSSS